MLRIENEKETATIYTRKRNNDLILIKFKNIYHDSN